MPGRRPETLTLIVGSRQRSAGAQVVKHVRKIEDLVKFGISKLFGIKMIANVVHDVVHYVLEPLPVELEVLLHRQLPVRILA